MFPNVRNHVVHIVDDSRPKQTREQGKLFPSNCHQSLSGSEARIFQTGRRFGINVGMVILFVYIVSGSQE